MNHVLVRIVEVHITGCTVEADGKLYRNVLIPFHGLMVGQQFEAEMLPTDDPGGGFRFENWTVPGRR